MKYDYSVIYNGKFYRAGEEVPVSENKSIESKNTNADEGNKVDEEAKTDEVSADDTRPAKSAKTRNKSNK
jgi:hypothetical protein